MSIFEKIKQFFKSIGNKQKLLESPKEIREELSDMASSSKKESKFREDIKFDPKDLLDPRVCQGDNFVPNILRTLGANEDVINNPQLISEIETQFFGIVPQNGLEMPNRFEQPTREQIEAIVESIKSNKPLTQEERHRRAYVHSPKKSEVYHGLSIDPETGSVTIQMFKLGHDREIAGDYLKESTFSADGKGNAIAESSYSRIDMSSFRRDENLSHTGRTTFNSDGIAIESDSYSYEQVDGEDRVNYHRIAKRDAEYPFIAQEEVLVNDISLDKHTGKRYMAIDMKDLAQLGSPEYQRDEDGKTTTTPITFENREQISEYYQENKGAIDNALMQEPDHGLFPTKQLKQALKSGIRKLAVKAGILPNEHAQETEIAE